MAWAVSRVFCARGDEHIIFQEVKLTILVWPYGPVIEVCGQHRLTLLPPYFMQLGALNEVCGGIRASQTEVSAPLPVLQPPYSRLSTSYLEVHPEVGPPGLGGLGGVVWLGGVATHGVREGLPGDGRGAGGAGAERKRNSRWIVCLFLGRVI